MQNFHTMRLERGESGFTLIEVLMSIVLLGIVSLAAVMLIYHGTSSYSEMDRARDITSQGQLAAERMMREITAMRCSNSTSSRCLPTATDIPNMTAPELRFINTLHEGRGIRYDSASRRLYLRRGSAAGDTEDILIQNVTALTFQYLDRSGVATAVAADVWVVLANLTLTDGNLSMDFRVRAHPKAFEW